LRGDNHHFDFQKMKLLTLRQLEELTGKHRKFLNELLQGIPFTPGANRARLYESTKALPAIYTRANSLEEARRIQCETAAHLNRIRAEVLSKTRIPIDLVLSIHDQVLQAMSATLKAAKGKVLTVELINNIFEDFRKIPDKLNW
jgi:hypothetical protein